MNCTVTFLLASAGSWRPRELRPWRWPTRTGRDAVVRERHGVAENLFRVFRLSMLITREPTSRLEPLTCSLRVSCSRAEKATRAASPCCWFQSILSAATRSKRTSCAPSISRARNLSSVIFVLRDVYRRGCGGKDGGQPSALGYAHRSVLTSKGRTCSLPNLSLARSVSRTLPEYPSPLSVLASRVSSNL